MTVRIYDVLGREVAALVSERLASGTHDVRWNASEAASGVYVYRMIAGGFQESKRMMVLK